MTDTALHRDFDAIDPTTPNGRIKSQLLGLYILKSLVEKGNLLDDLPTPVRTQLADYLSDTIVTELFTFLRSNSHLLGIDTDRLSDTDKEVLFITKLDVHQTAIGFACGSVIYDHIDGSVAMHYYNPYKDQNFYHLYYPLQRTAYVELGYDIRYHDPDTQEYKPFFGTINEQLDTFNKRLELARASFLLDK